MKTIPLSQGKFAMVDAADYDALIGYRWYAHHSTRAWYALRHALNASGGKTMVPMHRQIMQTPRGYDTDHINGDGLDNRRSNLRIATRQQNSNNQQRKALGKSSKYRGVSWHSQRDRWRAYIVVDNRQTHLGLFDCELAAAQAYDDAGFKRDPEHFYPNFLPITIEITR